MYIATMMAVLDVYSAVGRVDGGAMDGGSIAVARGSFSEERVTGIRLGKGSRYQPQLLENERHILLLGAPQLFASCDVPTGYRWDALELT